jgi:hypothetical protein
MLHRGVAGRAARFPPQPILAGHCHDTFERSDGRWRFVLREIAPELIGELGRHRRKIPDARCSDRRPHAWRGSWMSA